jgi:hypothetical protein
VSLDEALHSSALSRSASGRAPTPARFISFLMARPAHPLPCSDTSSPTWQAAIVSSPSLTSRLRLQPCALACKLSSAARVQPLSERHDLCGVIEDDACAIAQTRKAREVFCICQCDGASGPGRNRIAGGSVRSHRGQCGLRPADCGKALARLLAGAACAAPSLPLGRPCRGL